jgi:hypothetical protein
MSYYVTVRGAAGKFILAAGPFNRHGDALRMVGPVRELVGEKFPKEAPWVSFGTANSTHVKPGKFNDEIGLGERVATLDPEMPQGRWATGDTADPVDYVRRHDTAANARRMDRRLALDNP